MRNLWGIAGRIGGRRGKEAAGPGLDGGNEEGGRIQRGFFGSSRILVGEKGGEMAKTGDGRIRSSPL
jgi:hypothetical protein